MQASIVSNIIKTGLSRSKKLSRSHGTPSFSTISATLKQVQSEIKREFDAMTTNDTTTTRKASAMPAFMKAPLREVDPELDAIIEHDKQRQRESIILIASENYPSKAVLDATGSVLCNKYSEGYPGARYYGGNEFIDQSELLCQKRALEAFRLDPKEWGVNVQALSGSPANFCVYTALLNPHDRIMGLDLAHGGHLSHGHQISGKKISATSVYFESMHFRLDEKTGLIDYDKMEELAHYYRPKMMIAGTSAYSRLIDYTRIRKIADSVGAYLLGDICHISGLVAGDVIPSPFPHVDVVTTTTHKSLRGPRGALIFYRIGKKGTDKEGKDIMWDLKSKIDSAVFPGHQGGPHNHTIAAISTALYQCKFPEYTHYQQMVLKNAKAMGDALVEKGYGLVSGGTDTHLLLVDLNSKNLDGTRVDNVLDLINIAINKNTVPGDKSPLNPSGIRLGSPAMTSRGLIEDDFREVIGLLDKGVKYAGELKKKYPKKVDFKNWVKNEGKNDRIIKELKQEVNGFATKFDVPF